MTWHPRVAVVSLLCLFALYFLINSWGFSECTIVVTNPYKGEKPYKYAPIGSKVARREVIGPVRWKFLPKRVKNDFLMDGKMEYSNFFTENDPPVAKYVATWNQEDFDSKIAKAQDVFDVFHTNGKIGKEEAEAIRGGHYPCVIINLVKSLQEDFHLKGKDILVVNSLSLWNEALLIALGVNSVTSSDARYHTVHASHPKFKWVHFSELTGKYDAIFKFDDDIDAFSHIGLGRYGDRINPFADFERMKHLGSFLKPHGLIFFSLPLGPDLLEYNAHRVFGPKRTARLTEGFITKKTYPCLSDYPTLEKAWAADLGAKWENQWLFAIEKDAAHSLWADPQKEICKTNGQTWMLVISVFAFWLIFMVSKLSKLPLEGIRGRTGVEV